MPTDTPDVTGRTVDLNAEVRRIWGVEWGKPDVVYEFSSGRKFSQRETDAAIYRPQD